ncbi:MAG: TolC family protein [Saprospiraceae bacterium]|nr:TolC family protein [Saprospiraceae bacterium]
MLISNLLRKVTTHQLIKQFIIFILATLPFLGYSQQRFSLEEAVQRAQKSNGRLNIQKLDAVDAEHQLKEYYAIGMPKLSGGVSYNYFLDIPTNILPDFISPSIYGILIKENLIPSKPIDFGSGVPVQFGTKNNLTAKLDLSALIFDGSFFVGLKAQQLYRELIKKTI